ncbi:response regulator [Nitrososphaera sp. AFS]|uniref:response regulator n=1 Tax=Nitrososphaera sp. AFS TaxID=2301191 RepID=UPI00351AD6A2|nr:response regulator [Nitrososphaera sp. AFS]
MKNNSRILIIDDEPDITFAFQKGLRERGFLTVDTVNDPHVALSSFQAGSYDLLLIDIVMPQIDGFGLYEEIRKLDEKVKVCFITAFDVNYKALRAVFPSANSVEDIGCFIKKPVNVEDLVKHIEGELS